MRWKPHQRKHYPEHPCQMCGGMTTYINYCAACEKLLMSTKMVLTPSPVVPDRRGTGKPSDCHIKNWGGQ